jgi:hypothetical protein
MAYSVELSTEVDRELDKLDAQHGKRIPDSASSAWEHKGTEPVSAAGRIISATFRCAARFADVRAGAYASSVNLLFA